MRYLIDHDFHIHSHLSCCSDDPEQTNERILRYAKENGYRKIVLTNHYWDEKIPAENINDFYRVQNTAHIRKALPLPQDKDVTFLFGAEVEMAKDYTIGANRETYRDLSFVIVPTTHLHMTGFTIEEGASLERRREDYILRFLALLDADIPAHKTGIAHLTCSLMAPVSPEDHLTVLNGITDSTFGDLFSRAARKGFGIELNFPLETYSGKDRQSVLRPYRIAKECGCLFYLGSDAHNLQESVRARPRFEQIVNELTLTEDDKFDFE